LHLAPRKALIEQAKKACGHKPSSTGDTPNSSSLPILPIFLQKHRLECTQFCENEKKVQFFL